MTPLGAILVGIGLLALLAATVGATFSGLGSWANMVIAAAKAALVLWFFMELRSGNGLLRLVAFGSLAWLAILFGLGFSDWLTR
jgi:cytochrome c oxidase subunit 4